MRELPEAGPQLVLDAQEALRVRVLGEDRERLGLEQLLVVRGAGGGVRGCVNLISG